MDQQPHTETCVHCEEYDAYLGLRQAEFLLQSLDFIAQDDGWSRNQSQFFANGLKDSDWRSDTGQLLQTHQSKKSVAKIWLSIRTLRSSYG